MRNILLATIIALIPVSLAAAEQPRGPKPDKPANSGRLLPLKRAGGSNSCAEYGPGFAKVDGTGTCMKIGGAISIGAGGSSGSR